MSKILDDMLRQNASAVSKNLDAKISECLNEMRPGWTIETVSGRLGSVSYEDEPPSKRMA